MKDHRPRRGEDAAENKTGLRHCPLAAGRLGYISCVSCGRDFETQGPPSKRASIALDLKMRRRRKKRRYPGFAIKTTLGIEQLVNQFAKGDRYARRDLMDITKELVSIC